MTSNFDAQISANQNCTESLQDENNELRKNNKELNRKFNKSETENFRLAEKVDSLKCKSGELQIINEDLSSKLFWLMKGNETEERTKMKNSGHGLIKLFFSRIDLKVLEDK